MASPTSVSQFSILAPHHLSQSMFASQSVAPTPGEPRTPAQAAKSSHKAFRLNVSRSSSAMKLPHPKPLAGSQETAPLQPLVQPSKFSTYSPVMQSKTKSLSKNFVLDKSKLSPSKLQYRKAQQKKPTAVSVFDVEVTHTVLDTPPSNTTAGKDPSTFSAAVTQLSRLPRKASPHRAAASGQSTPQDKTDAETTTTESTTVKNSPSIVTIKKRRDFCSTKVISPKKGKVISVQETNSFSSGEDYFVDLIRTCWSAISGQSTLHSKFSISQISEMHNYFLQNHKTMQIMKNDCIVERPAPIHYKRRYPDRKLLLLDLDETLIHCTGDASQRQRFDMEVDFINHEGIPLTGYLNVRPYTHHFLEVMSENFEVVIFTASMKYYADRILKILDPHRKFISEVFYRDSCCRTRNEKLVKDLTVFKGIPLSDMVLVDNNTYCMWPQPDNGIPIINFEHDRKDQELLKLEPFLLSLKDSKHHNALIRSQFKLHQILQNPTLAQYYSHF